MFNRGFTSRANRIIKVLAQDEAKKFNSEKLLQEHIIIAILKENEGVAVRALQSLSVDIRELVFDIEEYLEKGSGPPYLGEVVPSSDVQRMVEFASEEAKNMGYNYIGTEHLLIGAMLDPSSIVASVLEEHNITVDKIKEAVVKIIGFGKTNFKKDTVKKTPYLDEFGKDLTISAKKGKLDKVIGRDIEIERVIQILSRRNKNNPVLIGEPGVGKTAIIEGLAQKIGVGSVPDNLQNKRIISIDLGQIVAGTKYRGEFEERMKKILKEIVENTNVIIFIDEIHMLIGAGSAEGTMDASNMLKPMLSRGEMRCIGATTLDEYKKYIEKDAALERRFQTVFVEEPSVNDTIAILNGVKYLYEAHHDVVYSEEAIKSAAFLSHRYISDRFLPDKALDLVDEAGARVKIKTSNKPQEILDIEHEIELLNQKKMLLIKEQSFEECEIIKNEVQDLIAKKDLFLFNQQKNEIKTKTVVTENDILEVISSITKIPLSRIEVSETKRLLKMEEELNRGIVGQVEAIKSISSSVRRSRAGLSSKKRPIGSFIFLGPTGVGKTELAHLLAEFIFGDKDALIRLDMSDFMEKQNVSRLVGAPPGYVGYDEGGLLTEKIRRKPYSVVLLDEIEKAHPDVFNILLQVLEEGELQDNLGHAVSFRNTIIIMTSNIGARQLNKDSSVGFTLDANKDLAYKEMKNAAMNELKRAFNPEFLNRIDEVVVFHHLTKEDLSKIVDIMFVETIESMREKDIEIVLSDEAKEFVIEKEYDKKYGARPLRRTLQKEISDPLSVELLSGRIKEGDKILVTLHGGEIVFVLNEESNKSNIEMDSDRDKRDMLNGQYSFVNSNKF